MHDKSLQWLTITLQYHWYTIIADANIAIVTSLVYSVPKITKLCVTQFMLIKFYLKPTNIMHLSMSSPTPSLPA